MQGLPLDDEMQAHPDPTQMTDELLVQLNLPSFLDRLVSKIAKTRLSKRKPADRAVLAQSKSIRLGENSIGRRTGTVSVHGRVRIMQILDSNRAGKLIRHHGKVAFTRVTGAVDI